MNFNRTLSVQKRQQSIPQLNCIYFFHLFHIRANLVCSLAEISVKVQIVIELISNIFHAHLEYLKFLLFGSLIYKA